MELTDSFDLFNALERLNLLENSPPLWWPKFGTFEVVIGALLTQNTQWSRVQISLENLRQNSLLDVESLCLCDNETLMELIRPSGLFKAKAANLIRLSQAMIEEFGSFEEFALSVTREWLLSQKGIGPETADSILCYACGRDTMVVDAYTARLLHVFGYDFESYSDLQEWCECGIRSHFDALQLSPIFAHFHGMIVEYVKHNTNGKTVIISPLFQGA